MSLYAVQDDVGNYWDFDNRGFHSPHNNARRNTTFNLALADEIVQINGGHVVELVEAPAKVVVSEAEAKILEGAKKDKHPCMYIAWKVQVDDEDRLMRAYVIGWTVEKPKLWNVKVPHTGAGWWYAKPDPDINHGKGCARPAFTGINNPQVRLTDAEIIKYDLQDCEKEEVTNHEQ